MAERKEYQIGDAAASQRRRPGGPGGGPGGAPGGQGAAPGAPGQGGPGQDSSNDVEYTILSITLSDGTTVDPEDTQTVYRVCTSNYSGTLPGSVFEDKEPVVPASEAPIDNITIIELLREESASNNGHISVDTGVRGTRIMDEN